MFVRVDNEDSPVVEGFSYINRDGDEEQVEIYNDELIEINGSGSSHLPIYSKDIPKLIKALQAAYDHIQKGK